MTWNEFKKQVEEKGVTDEMVIGYISVNALRPSGNKLDVLVEGVYSDVKKPNKTFSVS